MLLTPYFIHSKQWSTSLKSTRDRILYGLGRLGEELAPALRAELAKTLEIVNSFYSNSMEGNPTRIGEIFSAREGHLAKATTDRNNQLEHLAHIQTTESMAEILSNDPTISPASLDFLRELHKTFYQALPESMRIATLVSGKTIQIIPGKLRSQPASVGRFHAPLPGQLRGCLEEFQKAYDLRSIDAHDYLTALAAAHHRFLWIHPFPDGNGRVVRLLSEAMALRMGYDSHRLYSISRGLARRRKEYDAMLAAADAPRWNNIDGRGSLSLKGLTEFTEFFLDVMLDQIEFMTTLMQRDKLHARMETFLHLQNADGTLSDSENKVVRFLLKEGEINRGDIQSIARVERRQATNIAAHLLKAGIAQSDSPKGRLRLKINKDMARILFPEFFE